MRSGSGELGPSYFFISLVLGPLNSLLWYVRSSRYITARARAFPRAPTSVSLLVSFICVSLLVALFLKYRHHYLIQHPTMKET